MPRGNKAIDEYWASVLGCTLDDLNENRITVISHANLLKNYNGAFIFKRNSSCIVSVPEEVVAITSRNLQKENLDNIFNLNYLSSAFSNIDITIGPTWYGYVDQNTFQIQDDNDMNIKTLTESDQDLLNSFKANCSENEWEYSGINVGKFPVFGYKNDEKIVSAGTILKKTDIVGSIGVVTSKDQRGKSFGTKLVKQMTKKGLKQYRIIEYRTLESNVSSVKLAKSLGFENYCLSYSVRFKE